MAERPVFVPCIEGDQLVRELSFDFEWHPGFAPSQKKKNIKALHAAAAAHGYSPILEISTKSDERLGQRLSAFSLNVETQKHGSIPLECAFQGSKVFEGGGPFVDLYSASSREAKKDPRIRGSGRLIAFRFEDVDFPSEPRTAFYDWLYLSALFPHRDFLARLKAYRGFTDIEFNPAHSINCQARSCALFVAMMENGSLAEALASPKAFVAAMNARPAGNSKWNVVTGMGLFEVGSSSTQKADISTVNCRVKTEVKRERNVRAFAELSHANSVLLENAQLGRDGHTYELMASIIMSAFRFEAYLNHVGGAIFPFWKELERLPWRSKLRIIESRLEMQGAYDQRPHQTLAFVFQFRDSLAHGKNEYLEESEFANGESLEEIRRKRPLTNWEQLCTQSFATQAYNDTEKLIHELHRRARLPEEDLSRGGHSYSIMDTGDPTK